MKENRLPLFSVTKNDLDIQTFCTGGNGGQHRNAKRNGVRIIHRDSGARAEHRDGRDQGANREAAFLKLVENPTFRAWIKMECARRTGLVANALRETERAMSPENLRIDVGDGSRWIAESAGKS